MSEVSAAKLGPIDLAPGITRTNAMAVMLSALTSITLVAFVGFMQPFLFEEVFFIPKENWGSLTGNLAATQEIIVILLMGVVGAMSDNVGRRPLIVLGLVMLAAGYLIYPLANGETELFLFRGVIALGAVLIGGMHSALVADTPANNSRGKLIAFASVCTGIGMMSLAFGAGRLPQLFEANGITAALSGRYSFWVVAAVCLIVAVALRLSLKGGRAVESDQKIPLIQLLREGIAAAKDNPRIGLAYCCAFASRADLLVVGTYLSLWVVQAGAEQDISTVDSMIRYGMLFGIIQGTAMVWSLVMGIICDRFNRLLVIAVAFGLAAAAYFTMGAMTNPFGGAIIFACIFLGMGEISTIISGGALIGQEAPSKMRGSVLGIFGLCGAMGLLTASFLGGQVFDHFSPTAPFTMMSIINGIICLLALSFYRKNKKKV